MIITQTPLRISLLGGGTDFEEFYRKSDGRVLTLAIDKYVYCIVKKRFDKKIYINYSDREIVDKVGDIKHDLVREAMKKTKVNSGIEISFMSDIPSTGSGLGSSSSVLVGVLHALYLYKGLSVSPLKLAREACEIEIKILKKPIGCQDQYIAAFGNLRLIKFNKKAIKVRRLKISEARIIEFLNNVMVFFTGTTRKADSILSDQRARIKKNLLLYTKMSGLASKGYAALKSSNYKKLGDIINESWELKKSFSKKISNTEIEKIYKMALKAGAYGGKISGAGGGGFMTFIVPPGKRQRVRKALNKYKELKVGLSQDGSKVIFNIRN